MHAQRGGPNITRCHNPHDAVTTRHSFLWSRRSWPQRHFAMQTLSYRREGLTLNDTLFCPVDCIMVVARDWRARKGLTMTPAELAEQVATQIRTNPGSHYQGWWLKTTRPEAHMVDHSTGYPVVEADICNTTACVAGWSSVLAGDRVRLDTTACVTSDNRVMSYSDRGAELLGLTSDEAFWLFDAGRTKSQVLYALDELAAGKRISARTMFSGFERAALLEVRPEPPRTKVVHVARDAQTDGIEVKEAQRA